MQGEGVPLAGELLYRFRKELADRRAANRTPDTVDQPRRTAKELLAARDRWEEEKKRREAEKAAKAKARREREAAAARVQHLDSLVGREDELWQEVEKAVNLKLPKEYDRAVETLRDLRDLAARSGGEQAVAQRIRELRQRHHAKRTFVERLDGAELPK
jgi:hypothetical protein